MTLFGKNRDEVVDLLTKENKRLKRENQRLREQENEMYLFKMEYDRLIKVLEDMKDEYRKKLDEMSQIETEYRNYFDELKNSTN